MNIAGWFKGLFKDLSDDWSSGLLVKILAFIFAFAFAVVGLAVKPMADLASIGAGVGALLGLMTAFQWVQAATKNGAPDVTSPATNPVPIGFFQGPGRKPDAARWIKFLCFLAGVAILFIAEIWIRTQLMSAVGVAGAFFLICTSQEISTKAFGV